MPHGQKNEQGLIREMILFKEEKHMTEISENLIHSNKETSIIPSIIAMSQLLPDNRDIISLYKNVCDAKVDAIKANQEETLYHFAKKPDIEFTDDSSDVDETKVEICKKILEKYPIGPEKSLLDVSNDQDPGYECHFEDTYNNNENDSQSKNAN
ncbi:13389_t:CDS:2, partial [Acaulospora morrowiae]